MFNYTEDLLLEKKATHTAKEILQQGKVWKKIIEEIDVVKKAIISKIESSNAKKVIFLGAGSSAFIADIATALLRNKSNYKDFEYLSVPTTDIVAAPQHYIKNEPLIVVSFARSGNSPESIGAVEVISQLVDDAYFIHITCNHNGELAKRSEGNVFEDVVLLPEETHDAGFAMTSSVTGMVLTSYLLFNDTPDSAYSDKLLSAFNEAIPNFEKSIIELATLPMKRVIYLGSGPNFGVSHEVSLKILELSAGLTDSYYESSMGFRHGPKSLMHKDTMVIVLFSDDKYTEKYDVDIANEMISNELGNPIVVLGNTVNIKGAYSVKYPENILHDTLAKTLLHTVFGQMFALYNSIKLGITPDNPSPDGKVNRVVQGVILHKLEI